jgi:hypothetical protein
MSLSECKNMTNCLLLTYNSYRITGVSDFIHRPDFNNYKKKDLREIGWDGVDWVDLAQDRDHWRDLVNTVMNLRVP